MKPQKKNTPAQRSTLPALIIPQKKLLQNLIIQLKKRPQKVRKNNGREYSQPAKD